MLDWWWWQADFSWWHHTYGLIIPSWGEIENVPSNDVLPNVNIPLSTTPIVRLLSLSKIALKHNLISSLLVIAGGKMALHYKTLTKVYTGCPIVVCQRLERPLQSRLPCLWLARHWYCNKADDLPANITCYVRYSSYRITFIPILRHAMDGHQRYTVCMCMWTASVIFIEVGGFVLHSLLTVLKVEFDSIWLVVSGRRGVFRLFSSTPCSISRSALAQSLFFLLCSFSCTVSSLAFSSMS